MEKDNASSRFANVQKTTEKVFLLLKSLLPERWRGQKVRDQVDGRATDHAKPRPGTQRAEEAKEKKVWLAVNTSPRQGIPSVKSSFKLSSLCQRRTPQRSQAAEGTASPVCLYPSLRSREPMGCDAEAVPTVRAAPVSALPQQQEPQQGWHPAHGALTQPTPFLLSWSHSAEPTGQHGCPSLSQPSSLEQCRWQGTGWHGVDKGSWDSLDKSGTLLPLPELGLGMESSPRL